MIDSPETTPDRHAHRNLAVEEEPLDTANQALADALKVSFTILKGIMVVLLVLYLFSNVRCVPGHERALVLRFGATHGGVKDAGLVWAWPFPIDEIIPLPTERANTMTIESQTFFRRPEEVGLDLEFLVARGRLNPVLDGALLTGDKGLVHLIWKITYKFDEVEDFVSHIAGDGSEAAENLITMLVESTAVRVASERTAEEFISADVGVREEVRARVNDRLRNLSSGLLVTQVEIVQPTAPLRVRTAYIATASAQSRQGTQISQAIQERERMLLETAGSAYRELLGVLDEIDREPKDETRLRELQGRLDDLLLHRAEGEVGKMMQDANATYTEVASRMESDVQLYQALLPEYESNPQLLVARLWEQTRIRILNNPALVGKLFRPAGLPNFRLMIGPDPDQVRQEQRDRLQGRGAFDPSKLNEKPLRPVLPSDWDG